MNFKISVPPSHICLLKKVSSEEFGEDYKIDTSGPSDKKKKKKSQNSLNKDDLSLSLQVHFILSVMSWCA